MTNRPTSPGYLRLVEAQSSSSPKKRYIDRLQFCSFAPGAVRWHTDPAGKLLTCQTCTGREGSKVIERKKADRYKFLAARVHRATGAAMLKHFYNKLCALATILLFLRAGEGQARETERRKAPFFGWSVCDCTELAWISSVRPHVQWW